MKHQLAQLFKEVRKAASQLDISQCLKPSDNQMEASSSESNCMRGSLHAVAASASQVEERACRYFLNDCEARASSRAELRCHLCQLPGPRLHWSAAGCGWVGRKYVCCCMAKLSSLSQNGNNWKIRTRHRYLSRLPPAPECKPQQMTTSVHTYNARLWLALSPAHPSKGIGAVGDKNRSRTSGRVVTFLCRIRH